MAKICRFYSQNLSLILVLTCPVSYHSSTLGHFDQEYLKIKKNGPKMVKNGQKFKSFQQLQANNQNTHNETTWDEKNSVSAIQPNWLDTVGPTVQKIQHFEVGKSAKISHFFYLFVKKIMKMAKICHFYSQNLSLILVLTCPVSYHSSTLGHFDQEYLKIQNNGQKWSKIYTFTAIASK